MWFFRTHSASGVVLVNQNCSTASRTKLSRTITPADSGSQPHHRYAGPLRLLPSENVLGVRSQPQIRFPTGFGWLRT